MDPLSEILKSLRLEGAVFLESEFTAPWCVRARFGMPEEGDPAFNSRHKTAFFHWVMSGECSIQLAGDDSVLHAAAGDVILFPHDDLHLVGSDLKIAPTESYGRPHVESGSSVLPLVQAGGGGAATHLVCGYVACDHKVLRPLLRALPHVLLANVGSSPDGAFLRDALQIAVRKSVSLTAGNASSLTKLAELLFVEVIRSYAENAPLAAQGWLAGLKDPHVAHALQLLHSRPGDPWTVESLSREVALSRSTLKNRFVALVGEPPIHYLSQLRLAIAAQELAATRDSIGKIAERAGYESEAAFNRAFKREYGMPPAKWRRSRAD